MPTVNGRFETCLPLTLQHEGGYSNHPRDPGEATMKGVTLATFRRHFGEAQTVEDLKLITDQQLQEVYRSYWIAAGCARAPNGIDFALFDASVNSGPSRSVRFLQEAVGVRQDGLFGPKTHAAMQARDPMRIIVDMCEARLRFLRGLPTWDVFGRGWSRRVQAVKSDALDMADTRAFPSKRDIERERDEAIRERDEARATVRKRDIGVRLLLAAKAILVAIFAAGAAILSGG